MSFSDGFSLSVELEGAWNVWLSRRVNSKGPAKECIVPFLRPSPSFVFANIVRFSFSLNCYQAGRLDGATVEGLENRLSFSWLI